VRDADYPALSIAKFTNKRTYASTFPITIPVAKIIYDILHIFISIISFKCNSFEKHKLLNLLSILIAIKTNISNVYTHLLHKFIVQILDCLLSFSIEFLIVFFSINIVNYSELTNINRSYSFLKHIARY